MTSNLVAISWAVKEALKDVQYLARSFEMTKEMREGIKGFVKKNKPLSAFALDKKVFRPEA
jgi:hypothetical protein